MIAQAEAKRAKPARVKESKPEMYSEIVVITPEMASKWLNQNYENNRPLSQGLVEQYARDMRAGNWKLTHEGIALCVDGRLIDGQHRLWAIVEAGLAVAMMVCFNVSADSVQAVNTGRSRNKFDIMQISGLKPFRGVDAICRRLRQGMSNNNSPITTSETMTLFEKNREALEFVHSLFQKGRKGVTQAGVKAALAQAYYHVSHDDIRHFVEVLTDGLIRGERDEVIIKLRDVLMGAGNRMTLPTQFEAYSKCQRALKSFVDNVPIARHLTSASQDYFPLPGERKLSENE